MISPSVVKCCYHIVVVVGVVVVVDVVVDIVA